MASGWSGVRTPRRVARLAVAASALHGAACGGHTSDATTGSGAEGGSAGAGGSSGAGLVDPRCNTRDDGAEVLADDLVGVITPALDATHLYCPFLGGGPTYVTTIYKMCLEVSAPLEKLWTGEGSVNGLVLSEQHVWWAHQPLVDDGHPWDPSSMTLFRAPKTGGPAEAMITGYVQGIVSSPRGLVILRMNDKLEQDSGTFQLLPWSGGAPTDLCAYQGLTYVAANATLVVWMDEQGIEMCPLTPETRSPVRLIDTTETPVALAVDSTHAFWSAFVVDAMYRVPLTGGARETVAVSTQRGLPPYSLVLDGEDVFFPSQSRILRVPKVGGSPRDAVPPQTDLLFFTVGARHIYWGEGYPTTCLKRMLK